ncbi:MAG: hypothetical protein Q8P59_09535, partial [Dehalococcoidia bacterium]|nr:hypothetical protein [Dehalococcoidia bacterium]
LTHVQLRKGLDMLARSFYGKIGFTYHPKKKTGSPSDAGRSRSGWRAGRPPLLHVFPAGPA